MSLLASACLDEAVDDGTLRRSEVDVIIDNLLAAGYPPGEIGVTEAGEVFVGRDAVVTLEASREIAGIRSDLELFGDDGFRQYRTTNVVDTTQVHVICIDPDSTFASNAPMLQALDTAIARYNAEGLLFTMQRGGNNCDAHVTGHTNNSSGGVSGFPFNGLPYHEFYVGKDLANDYGQAVAAHVIEHELGHTIGFRHSDYYDRSISCGGSASNEGDGGVGVIHIEGTPMTAVVNGSVMNSCFNIGSTGIWTASDVVALDCLYDTGSCAPPPPPDYDNLASLGDLTGAVNTATHYGPYDATGFDAMRFRISGGLGDADLYVRHGAPPTLDAWDCRPYVNGNEEICEINPSSDGLYYVMLFGFKDYWGVTLSVDGAGSVQPPPPPPPPPNSCGDDVCDVDESCDGRNGTTACPSDCDGKVNGKPSSRYCYVGGVCEGPGCP